MAESKTDELVAAWLGGEHTMWDACDDEPENAWSAIVELARRELTADEKGLLAAGPIESLLFMHGAAFIDRIEEKAKQDPQFNYLLGGVWQMGMTEEIWQRVKNVRKEVW